MSDPKFVEVDDVTGRYEGDFPAERESWLELRIADVENELMGQVPSLRKTLDDITTDSTAAGDPGRMDRIKTLICDKVLELFRNPDGAITIADGMDGITRSRSYSGRSYAGAGNGVGIAFTEAELNRVRLPKVGRPKLGTFAVSPWGLP